MSAGEQTATLTTLDRDNPWPGLLAFREGDEGYFQGRQTETEDLLRLVLRERLTVLFGLSGLGKSSLLQAGLFPRLRQENVFPVYIRFDFSSDRPDLVAQVIATIAREASAHQIEAPPAKEGKTLWEHFHLEGNNFWNARNRPVMPLLVFDQFEELFTLGRLDKSGRLDPQRWAVTDAFLDQLADLAECRPPAQLKARVDDHPEEASAFNFGRHYYKILGGIREDFLPDLETLRTRMPTVALNRLRLLPMNGNAALLVVNQAQHLIEPDVAEQVVHFVAADQSHLELSGLKIEPALLSVVCRELNNRRQNLGEGKISAGLLQGNQEQVLADFYERSMADLPPEVRLFIEDHLLTVAGYRDSAALDNALSTPGVTRRAIDALVERRLVRREDRGGVQRLELTHDVLVKVVRASRDSRRQQAAAENERARLLQAQEEQRQALLKAQEDERIKLEKARDEERRDRDRRDLRRFRIAATVFLALTIASMGITGWALHERKKAAIAQGEAERLKIQAENQAAESAKQAQAVVELYSKVKGGAAQAEANSQSSATELEPRAYMQIVNPNDRDYANKIKDRLTAAGILVPGIEYVPAAAGLAKTEVRYYKLSDEAEAQKIVSILQSAGAVSAQAKVLPGYEDSKKIRPHHFEVWLANDLTGTWVFTMVSSLSKQTYTGTLQLTMNGTGLSGNLLGSGVTGASPVNGTFDAATSTIRLTRDTGLQTLQDYVLSGGGNRYSGTFQNRGKYPDSGTFEIIRR